MTNKTTDVSQQYNTMSFDAMLVEYSSKNVYREKCDLYGDYIKSLLLMVFDTYVGDEYMDVQQKLGHFDWCWKRNRENFKKEGFDIHSDEIYGKFLIFVTEGYYPVTEKTLAHQYKLLNIWAHLFNFTKRKKRDDVDCFLRYYELFDRALNK